MHQLEYVRTRLVEAQIAQRATVHIIPKSDVVTDELLSKNTIKRLVEPAEVGAPVWHTRGEVTTTTGSPYAINRGRTAYATDSCARRPGPL